MNSFERVLGVALSLGLSLGATACGGTQTQSTGNGTQTQDSGTAQNVQDTGPAQREPPPPPPPPCVATATRQEGFIGKFAASVEGAKYCLAAGATPEAFGTFPEGSTPDCWSLTFEGARWEHLEARDLTAAPIEETDTGNFRAVSTANSVTVCQGNDESLCKTKRFGAGYRTTTPASGPATLVTAVTEEGVFAVVKDASPGDACTSTIETYDWQRGRRLGSFRVSDASLGNCIARIAGIDKGLLVSTCAAGPSCTARLLEPRRGTIRTTIQVNTYTGQFWKQDGDVWVFADSTGSKLEWVNVATGTSVRLLETQRTENPDRGPWLQRLANGMLVLGFDGNGGPETGTGDVLTVDLSSGELKGRFSPPVCTQ